MKQYPDLTPVQKERAIQVCYSNLLASVVTGEVTFKVAAFQEKIDNAIKEANRLKTPWFAADMVDEACGLQLRQVAQEVAADKYMFYPEEHDQIIPGVFSDVVQEAAPAPQVALPPCNETEPTMDMKQVTLPNGLEVYMMPEVKPENDCGN